MSPDLPEVGDDCPGCGEEIVHSTIYDGVLYLDHEVTRRRNCVEVEDGCVLDPEDFDQ